MASVNANYLKLKGSYLFIEIARRVKAYQEANPDARIIRLGIGDVTRPLPPAVVEAMHRATDEMARADTFRGYGPERGYDFLAEQIVTHDFAPVACRFLARMCSSVTAPRATPPISRSCLPPTVWWPSPTRSIRSTSTAT